MLSLTPDWELTLSRILTPHALLHWTVWRLGTMGRVVIRHWHVSKSPLVLGRALFKFHLGLGTVIRVQWSESSSDSWLFRVTNLHTLLTLKVVSTRNLLEILSSNRGSIETLICRIAASEHKDTNIHGKRPFCDDPAASSRMRISLVAVLFECSGVSIYWWWITLR